MRGARVAGAAGLATLAGLFLTPGSAWADPGVAPSGAASASSITVSISPQALLVVPTSLLDGLQSQPTLGPLVGALKGAISDGVTISLDNAAVQGTLNHTATDLTTGKATSQAVAINIKGLDDVLNQLNALLSSSLPTGTSLSGLSTALQNQVAALNQQLAQITAPVTGLLGQVAANTSINKVLAVNLDEAPARAGVLDLTTPIGSLNLAPFEATALSTAGATRWGASDGPELEAHNTTTHLDLGKTLTLGTANVNGIISTLLGPNGLIATEISALQGAAGAVSSAGPVSLQCPALLAQLPLCDLIQQQPAAQATQTLKAELATLQSLATTLSGLQGLLDQLNTIDLNKLVYADGVTSAVKTRPEKGGVHSIAATSFADLKILQLLSDQFASHTGTPVGTPFLELKGVNSSADAFVNGKDTSKPAGTASLGEIDVLGQRVLDVNGTLSDALHQTLNAGTTITKTVTTPIGDLTLVVSRGEPKPVNNSAQRKTMQVAALDVALLNGDTDGSHAITQLGAQRGGKIVDVAVAQSQVDAAMTVVPQCAPADCSASVTINPVLPSTGMLGPLGFLAAAGLAAVAVSLRLAGRRRRRVG